MFYHFFIGSYFCSNRIHFNTNKNLFLWVYLLDIPFIMFICFCRLLSIFSSVNTRVKVEKQRHFLRPNLGASNISAIQNSWHSDDVVLTYKSTESPFIFLLLVSNQLQPPECPFKRFTVSFVSSIFVLIYSRGKFIFGWWEEEHNYKNRGEICIQ